MIVTAIPPALVVDQGQMAIRPARWVDRVQGVILRGHEADRVLGAIRQGREEGQEPGVILRGHEAGRVQEALAHDADLIENKLRLETSPFRGIIKHGGGVTSSVLFRPTGSGAD